MNSDAMDRQVSATNMTGTPTDELDEDVEACALLERINARENLIVLSWPSARLAAVLANNINRRTSHGKNTVILSEISAGGEKLDDLESLLQTNAAPFGCRRLERRQFLESLDGKAHEAWFDHLDLVLIPNVDDSLCCPFEWEHVCYRILDRCSRRDLPTPQLVLICSPRNHAEGALRRNFPIFNLNTNYQQGTHVAHEKAFAGTNVNRIWWTLWAAEEIYARPLISPAPEVEYGVESLLGYYVGLRRVTPSYYHADPGTPIEDNLESLQNRLSAEGKTPWQQVMQGYPEGTFIRQTSCGGETLRDAAGNPWRALRALSERGGEALLVNLVLPPTVLRGYLVANAAYFADHPLEPLTPRMQSGVFDAVTQLYLRLSAGGGVALQEVRRVLERCNASAGDHGKDVFSLLKDRVKKFFGAPIAERLLLESDLRWHPAHISGGRGGRFLRQTCVVLHGNGMRTGDVPWLQEMDVIDERNSIADRIRQDHVYQTYVPGQSCVLAGKVFHVQAIEADAVRIRKSEDGHALYRSSVSITLTDPASRQCLESKVDEGAGYRFTKDVFEISFRIGVQCWWKSTGFGTRWRKSGEDRTKDREYRQGRALRIALTDRNGRSLWSRTQAMTLAQWINEAAVTLFPESHRFLIAAACVPEAQRPQAEPARDITPRLSFIGKKVEKADMEALWIFEDSNADLGIVGACFDRAEWLLNLCLDYLNWRLDETGSDKANEAPCLLNQDKMYGDLLAYGSEHADPAFDFSGLRDCLETSELIDARQSLTEARRLALSETHPIQENSSGSDSIGQQCDFCLQYVEGEQGQMLTDGRFRCLDCGTIAIDRLEGAKKICDEVLEIMRKKFRIELRQAVEVSFVDASRIASESGETFVPTGEFDSRSVGLAVATYNVSGRQRFMVFVEHGHSYASTAMTLAHEFAHIWQYEWLDYQRMEKDHGKLLIEGHATWAELACGRILAGMSTHKEKNKSWIKALDQREADLLSRQDEYGVGYRLLLDMGGVEVDGFEMLGAEYGLRR